MQITVYSQSGKAVGEMALPPEIFAVRVNAQLVHRAIVRQESNARHPIAHTLTRAERAGSTRKLFRQKGTGRARPGDIRTPNRKKGGVAMGPRNDRNFEIGMTRSEQRNALFSSLSLRAADESIIALQGFEGAKTKDFAGMLSKLPVKGKTLFVLPSKDAAIERSSRNIPTVQTLSVDYLNPRDILRSASIVFVGESLSRIPAIWKPSAKRTSASQKPAPAKTATRKKAAPKAPKTA